MTYTGCTSCSPPRRPCIRHSRGPPPLLRTGGSIEEEVKAKEVCKSLWPSQARAGSAWVTFPALQPGAGSVRDVVGGVAAEAAARAAAQAAVVGAALAAPPRAGVEALGTGVHTPASVQVALHPKLIWSETTTTGTNVSLFRVVVIFGPADGSWCTLAGLGVGGGVELNYDLCLLPASRGRKQSPSSPSRRMTPRCARPTAHQCRSRCSWRVWRQRRCCRCGRTGDSGPPSGTCPWHTPSRSGRRPRPCQQPITCSFPLLGELIFIPACNIRQILDTRRRDAAAEA